MRQFIYKTVFLSSSFLFAGFSVFAQKDTTRSRKVEITSAFKPVLRESAKINFNASPPTADTAKPKLQYDIPNPNLLFAYQPGSLKPLALLVDSNLRFDNKNYIKAGFGSLKTPYVQAGFSFGDGNTAGINIYAKHVSSQGKREFQDFTNTQVKLSGFYKAAKNMEWNASLGMNALKTYKYGFTPESLSFPTDSIRLNYQTYSARVNAHNINKTEFGLGYSPEIRIDVFTDNLKNTESNTVVDLPLQKNIGKDFTVKLGLTFDLTRLSPKNKSGTINNTMYYISPSVLYKKPNLNLQIGIRPSWDNKAFKMFPNILADVGTEDQRFTFQAGWTGYLRKTSYQYLVSQNPWLWLPATLQNTKIEERFAGFKGSIDDHFTYSAKVAFNKLNNQPLFINDTVGDGKSFRVVNEEQINVLNFGGELGYNVEEKFSLITSLSFNQYSGLKTNRKAWGLLPLELTAAMRLQIIKDLWLKGDLFAWNGALYMKKDGSSERLDGAFDLNAGLEFKITKNLNLWTQFNNIFNKEYQRWNQYPVYGFNFAGGIVFSFDQK
ncbi:MAG TPA: hypothetical protein VI461_16090 [Chitinophagaceae bacterium]|nr:hypothetical protein [Chitinophagaceae bacterium]